MDQPVTVALIGNGAFGKFVDSSLEKSSTVNIVQRSREDFPSGSELVAQLEEGKDPHDVFAPITTEAVHIATPPFTHAILAVAALKAGKHVLLDKPMALHPTEAKDIVDTAQQEQKVLGINYVMRYNPVIEKVKAIIKDNIFGKLRWVRMENIAHGVEPADHWFWDMEKSGGIHIEHGVHFFDLAADILQTPPSHVEGALLLRNGINTEAVATVQYGNTQASFYHGFFTEKELEFTEWVFVFDRARLVIQGWIPLHLAVQAKMTEEEIGILKELEFSVVQEEGLTSATYDFPDDKQSLYARSVEMVWQDVAQAIRNNTGLLASSQNGLESLTVAWQASQKRIEMDNLA